MTKGDSRRPSSKTRLRHLLKAVTLYRRPSGSDDLNLMDSIISRQQRLISTTPSSPSDRDRIQPQSRGAINLGPVTFARAAASSSSLKDLGERKGVPALKDEVPPPSNPAHTKHAESPLPETPYPDLSLPEQPLPEHLQILPPPSSQDLRGDGPGAAADTEQPLLPFTSRFDQAFICSATMNFYEQLRPPRIPSPQPSRDSGNYYQVTG
mmetsp:Transcript_70537/g.159571  ORF Transcript_70537/g.159571 Transcript_70537/m.159571 type:complete len:209 (+) Transcript_70537:112-738(+)